MFDIDNSKAQNIIKSFQVPAKPKVLVELQQEQSKGEPSLHAFAEVIAKDVALSATVLKTVNSPVFGLNRAIADIRQAVILLGCQNISNLVSFFQLRNALSGKACISLEKFWDVAMDTANMMTLLLKYIDLETPCSTEDAYAFGLFRDCGIPLMAMKFDDYKSVLMEANAHHEQIFTDIEEGYYETNHAVVGFFVANSWNLPKNLCELIQRHHEPDFLDATDVSTEQKSLYAMSKIAGNALSQYKYQRDDCEWFLAKDSVQYYFGLSELDYADLQADLIEAYTVQYGE